MRNTAKTEKPAVVFQTLSRLRRKNLNKNNVSREQTVAQVESAPVTVSDAFEFRGQRGDILRRLLPGVEVSSLDLGNIALQYQARLAELKKAGYDIRKVRDQRVNGRRHCGYRLFAPANAQPVKIERPASANAAPEHPIAIQDGMFAEPIGQWFDPETSWGRR